MLEKDLNVQDTCGYIRLLKTGALPTSKKPHPSNRSAHGSVNSRKETAEEKAKQTEISDFLDDLRELGIGQPKSPKGESESTLIAEAKSQTEIVSQNGTTTSQHSHSNAEVTGPETSHQSHSDATPAQKKLASEWVPLELSFGIPLFSDSDNKAVCDKVHGFMLRIILL